MTFTVQVVPISNWPRPDTENRRPPQFRSSYDATLSALDVELEHLEATGVVAIQVVTRNGAADLRRDGMLAARAEVLHPGVVVSFNSAEHGSLTYATDKYEPWYGRTPAWQHNLRAIVLGLEALRAVNRYGIADSGEQYRGWAQIEGNVGSTGMSDDVAWSVLVEESGLPVDASTRPDAVKAAVRLATKNAHPDHNHGDPSRWGALSAALATLGLSS